MEQEITTTSDVNSEPPKKNLGGLLEEAHQALACFDVETARSLFSAAAQQFPENDKALFEFGYFLYEQNEHNRAETLLKRSIELEPLKNAKKYFTLAQLSTQDLALASNLYIKGIEIAARKRDQSVLEGKADKVADSRRQIAQGYCGLAHLEINRAELGLGALNSQAFLDCVKHAIASDPFYLEPYSQLAIFYFNMNEEALCRNALAELTAKVQELDDKEDDDLNDYGPDFFLPIARIMVELELWEEGVAAMEAALQSDNRDLEANYLHAFCLFKTGEFAQAAEACQELEKLKILESGDEELIEGFLELKSEVQHALAQLGPSNEPKLKDVPDSDNDWVDDD